MKELDEVKEKRNYLKQLEDVREKLYELYNYEDIKCIRALWDPYKFTTHLDIFAEALDNEISYQERKLNDSEVIVYNMCGKSQD